MSSQGKAYTLEQKEFIVRLKQSFDEERATHSSVSTRNPAARVAKGLKVGLSTVKTVLAEYHRAGQVSAPVTTPRGQPPYRVGSGFESLLRQRVRELNRRGEYVSVRTLRSWLGQVCEQEAIPVNTLWRTLKRMGFVHATSKRRSTLKERDAVIIARREYLRDKRANRKPDGGTYRPEVYLDETYLNVNHSKDRTWYFEPDGPWVNKPAGKGARLIIVQAMSSDGWLPKAKLVFQAKKRTGDYHGQMDSANFAKWFSEQLLPNLAPHSLIIMDPAPYHNELAEDAFPKPSTTKAQLQQWLKPHHRGEYRDDMLKPELYKKCRQLRPPPKLMLDLLAEAQGHTILRTPPYHPELQPIETCWAITKEYCARRCDYTMASLKSQLEAGFDQVTAATCQGLIQKVREVEDQYWQEDEENDNHEPFDDLNLRPHENDFSEAEEEFLKLITSDELQSL
jgi:transposase